MLEHVLTLDIMQYGYIQTNYVTCSDTDNRLPRWDVKHWRGCVFSPPSLLLVGARREGGGFSCIRIISHPVTVTVYLVPKKTFSYCKSWDTVTLLPIFTSVTATKVLCTWFPCPNLDLTETCRAQMILMSMPLT